MGTNYSLKINVCGHCKKSDRELHIGKSSGGWTFALHVIPEEGINSLDDWQKLFNVQGNVIVNEYGETITAEEMLREITERRHPERPTNISNLTGYPYKDWNEFHSRNQSEDGPNNLIRRKIDGVYCIGHGSGTWDLLIGDFS